MMMLGAGRAGRGAAGYCNAMKSIGSTASASRATSHECMRCRRCLRKRAESTAVEPGRLNLCVGGKEIRVARGEVCCCTPVLAAFSEECTMRLPAHRLNAHPSAALECVDIIITGGVRGIT